MKTYLAWSTDYDQTKDDARIIPAHDARAAAEEWAEWHDAYSAEFSCVGGQGVDVTVVENSDGAEEVTFRVEGESVPTYRARKLFAPAAGDPK